MWENCTLLVKKYFLLNGCSFLYKNLETFEIPRILMENCEQKEYKKSIKYSERI